ncbi:MAG: ABC transporter permease [Desulfovibrionaceae bacterium]
MPQASPPTPQARALQNAHAYTLIVSGTWNMNNSIANADALMAGIDNPQTRSLCLQAENLESWDTSVLVFLVRAVQAAKTRNIPVDDSALPEGLRQLLVLAFAVPPQAGSARSTQKEGVLASIGASCLGIPLAFNNALTFLGEVTISLGRLFQGKADMRMRDVFAAMQDCGVNSLPIISITSLLFGLILAFVGAVQLTQFGAQIYVAGLVGIGMLRVMGAIMVGVVMAGRMGASYAALIGTMQVNEEVDALATFSFSPTDFLVLPRLLALTAMIPLLTLYADLMGVVGGFLVGVFMLGLHPLEYLTATMDMVPYKHIIIGLVYGTVFGIIIALVGCYQGMRCGRSAAAVGMATTAAVVNSIVFIIIATAVITIICNTLKI